jgi:hypothetical protein
MKEFLQRKLFFFKFLNAFTLNLCFEKVVFLYPFRGEPRQAIPNGKRQTALTIEFVCNIRLDTQTHSPTSLSLSRKPPKKK